MSQELKDITAAWVPFSRRLEIARSVGMEVDQRFNQIVRMVAEYVVQEYKAAPPPSADQPRPALVTALRGLLASLQREPTEFELRAAAHEFTVQADRVAAGRSRKEDGDA